ncbi:MAG: YdcF family protein [Cyclobacteriaceae bacterium]
MINDWETGPIRKDEIPLVKTAVVLGGILDNQNSLPEDQVRLNSSSERLIEALILYKAGVVRRIIISGGDGSMDQEGDPESLVLQNLSRDLIGRSKILIDSLSKNTYENAVNTSAILSEIGLEEQPILLITSAFHMPRALKCFEKQGIVAIPFPVDYRGTDQSFQFSQLVPDNSSITLWNILIKEWVGILVYKTLGYA